MVKLKQRAYSLLIACLTALMVVVFAIGALLVPPQTTTALAAEETTVTITVTGTTGIKDGTTSISWTSGDVTFTNYKTSNSSAIVNSDSNLYRVYANSKGEIEAPGNITKIVITCTSGSYATACKNSFGDIATVSGSTVTITPTGKATSVVFEKATAQFRLNKIAVTYEIPTGGDVADPECTHEGTETTVEHVDLKHIVKCSCGETITETDISPGAGAPTHVTGTNTHKIAYTCSVDGCGAEVDDEVVDCCEGTDFVDGQEYVCACGNTFVYEALTEDVLNRGTTGVTGTNYANWSGKTATSSAVYAGQSAGGNESIQLRATSPSGIFTTTSGGKVKKITVVWNSNTADGRTLNIYGKNTAYTAASDLYDTSKQGTILGSIVKGTSTELTISGDYEYIGMRSNSGAMYLTSITISWKTCAHSETTTTTVEATCTENGSETVSCTICGAEISKTIYPATGHTASDWIIDTEAQVGVAGSKHKECTVCEEVLETESIPALDAEKFTVSYSVPKGIQAPNAVEIADGATVTLPAVVGTDFYTFVGWVEQSIAETTAAPTFYAAETEYTVTENVTFYALFSFSVSSSYKDWTLVTNANDLSIGSQIIIASADSDFALSTTQNSNNRGQATIAKNNNVVTFGEDVQIIALEAGAIDGTFAFNVGTGYLYAASSASNHLKTQDEKDNNASWAIAIGDNGEATVQAQGTYSHNVIRYNQTSKLFSCYEEDNNQKAIVIYQKKAAALNYTTDFVAFSGASLTIGSSLDVNFYVTLPEGVEAPQMNFKLATIDVTVDGVEEGGRYKYVFEGLAPQFMGDTITATLLYGEGIVYEYSVKTYAVNTLAKAETSNELKQFLVDMLTYGAAAQKYQGYNTENLVTDGVDMQGFTASTATPTEASKYVLTTEDGGESIFASANLWFDNVNKICVKLNAPENVTLKVNGVDVELNGNVYYTDVIYATGFAATYTFTVYVDGELQQTLTYSVNSYAYSKMNSATMGELALALYRYGVSAGKLA